MDFFQRNKFHFRSLPWSLERRSSRYYRANSPSLTQRRHAISADSYNEVRKRLLNRRLPTVVLGDRPTREIRQSNFDLPIAASSFYILTFVNQCSALILFDECREVYRLDLSKELVYLYDLCWSTKLNRFLLAGYSLYTFDPRSHDFAVLNEARRASRAEWIVSLSCDDRFVYLLYSSRSTRLERRSLFSLTLTERQWTGKVFLRRNDFFAQSIRLNQWNVIGILIRDKFGQWRVDLFHSTDFHRIFSGERLGQGIPGLRNSVLISYQRMWIVMNNSFVGEKIVLLDETSRILSSTPWETSVSPWNLCCLGDEWLVVNRRDRLSFYAV